MVRFQPYRTLKFEGQEQLALIACVGKIEPMSHIRQQTPQSPKTQSLMSMRELVKEGIR